MRRFIAFIITIAAVLTAVPVIAEDNSVNAYRNGETIVVESTESEKAVLSLYNDNVLCYSTMAVLEEGTYTFNVPSEYDGARMRICYIGGNTYEAVLGEAPIEPPTEAPTEVVTEAPTVAPTEKPTRTPVPEVYERSLDALNAPAVVMDVTTEIIDGETYHLLTMLYQGKEVSTYVRDWVEIKSAPHESLVGKNATALDEGDVIHFTNDLQGRIKSIEFIYRPDFADYIADGTDLAGLCGRDGYSSYSFGIPTDKTKGSVALADETGAVTELDIHSKVFVYKVSSSKRADKVTLEGTGYSAVETNFIHKTNLDEDGNVIAWEDTSDFSYALVRSVNGTATEIIMFGE